MKRSSVKAVILAGGLGKRLGLGPKAMVCLGGKTLLERAVETLATAGISSMVAVLPEGCTPVRSPCDVLFNPNVEQGPFGSLCLAFRHFAPISGGLLVMPVDHPLVLPSTVRSLLEHHEAAGELNIPYLSPTTGGEPGHPVLLRRQVLELLAKTLPTPQSTLRDVLKQSGSGVSVAVNDEGIHFNVNHPQDLERAGAILRTRPRAT